MTAVLLILAVAPTVAALTVWSTFRLRPTVVLQPAEPEPLDILRDRLRATVLVTLKTGQTYKGALWEADDQALVLRGAQALHADGSSVGVDGELLLLRGDVAYIQKP